ncbi:MAG: hypothetical protein IKR42_08070 [Campylobacter sp.]|nr:hypothetical protein [Campylobacter sp.]
MRKIIGGEDAGCKFAIFYFKIYSSLNSLGSEFIKSTLLTLTSITLKSKFSMYFGLSL